MIDKKKGVLYVNEVQMERLIQANSQSGMWSAIRAICTGFSIGSVIPAILSENIWWLLAIIPLVLCARYTGRKSKDWQKVTEHVTKEIREGVIS